MIAEASVADVPALTDEPHPETSVAVKAITIIATDRRTRAPAMPVPPAVWNFCQVTVSYTRCADTSLPPRVGAASLNPNGA